MQLTNMEDNMFANLLYDKPISQRGDSILKRIKKWFKRKEYEANTIKPMIKKLRNTAPSFITMCEMTDFIKILEKVFFYKNDVRRQSDEGPLITKLLSDNNIDKPDEKALMLEMQKEEVTMRFLMSRRFNADSEKYDDIIDVKVNFYFGKKLYLNYKIINTKVEFESAHDYNLMYNINIILQDSMADLFEKYYKLV